MGQDDQLWALIAGGIIGAGLASPNQNQQQELQEYRRLKQQIQLRQQRIGQLPNLDKLRAKSQFYNVFVESFQMYLHGFFRGSSILCVVLIESLLKEKFGEDKRLVDLIKHAEGKSIVSKAEAYYLHGMRFERNDLVHEIMTEVKEQDCLFILMITIKLIDKVLEA